AGAAPLAGGGGENPAGPAVGARVVQATIASLEHDVEDLLLGDRVADLHRPTADRLGFLGQLQRRERRPVDAVPPGPPADGHDQVAGLRRLLGPADRDEADRSAEDEWVG